MFALICSEVTRTFLKMYGESLKLNQDQIEDIDVS